MRDKILNFLKDKVSKAYQDRDITTAYYTNLDNGYSVVLVWEDGFDTKNGYGLCVSLRVTDSSYFVSDWDIVKEDCSLQECDINYEEISDYIMDLIRTALTNEQISKTKELFDLGDYLMLEYLVTLELPTETMNQVKKVMDLNNEVFGDGEINFTYEKENQYFEEFNILMAMLGLEKTCNGLIEI